MGQSQSAQLSRDTIVGEQYREYCDYVQTHVNKGFAKCVPSVASTGPHDLSAEEKACLDEYAFHFATFTRNSFGQFQHLYQQHQMDMYERARQEHAKAMSQQDAARMRSS
jgi:hypothetical protein